MKTDTKHTHTQGPWRTEGWENLVVNSADGYTMTLAAGGKDACLDELKANARLIAAAPELFEALREIESELTALLCERVLDSTLPEFFQVRAARNSARAAIAKVEGNA